MAQSDGVHANMVYNGKWGTFRSQKASKIKLRESFKAFEEEWLWVCERQFVSVLNSVLQPSKPFLGVWWELVVHTALGMSAPGPSQATLHEFPQHTLAPWGLDKQTEALRVRGPSSSHSNQCGLPGVRVILCSPQAVFPSGSKQKRCLGDTACPFCWEKNRASMGHWGWWARGHALWVDADRQRNGSGSPLPGRPGSSDYLGWIWMDVLLTQSVPFRRKSSNSRGKKGLFILKGVKEEWRVKGRKQYLKE